MSFISKYIKEAVRLLMQPFGQKSQELLTFLFFLCVSFGFWLLQALNETVYRNVKVIVRLEHVPSDVVIIDSLPAIIHVTVRDKGLTLARQSIASIFSPVELLLDFRNYEDEHEYADVTISSRDMRYLLSRKFSPSAKIQAIRPDSLFFSFNHGRSRILPIRLAASINASEQNYIQGISLSPDSMRVYGSALVLDTMTAVYTEPLVADGLTESSILHARLQQMSHVKYHTPTTSVKVGVGYFTEKTLSVPIVGTNFPADKKLRTFPAKADVTFRIESGRYNKVKADDFVLVTTYEELLQSTGGSRLMLQLKSLPSGVSNVRITPQEVDYLIEQIPATDSDR